MKLSVLRHTLPTILFCITLFFGCQSNKVQDPIFLGQGLIVGEVDEDGAILQTRLTTSKGLVNGKMIGKRGFARFIISEDTIGKSSTIITTPWHEALPKNDFIIKHKLRDLEAGKEYFYKVEFGLDSLQTAFSNNGTFRTLPGKFSEEAVSFVVVTGMNYYHFHYGKYDSTKAYKGSDKSLGYPALKTILDLAPDYFIGTGDNVYFDHPDKKSFDRATERGDGPARGLFGGLEVITEEGMRRKYHVQFSQQRFIDLFSQVGTYWEKDDHDYRFNDADPYNEFPISHELGIKNFKEQLPIVAYHEFQEPTYRTYQMNKHVQIWLLEGRDYRSANSDPDGPEKSIWGNKQKSWLKETLKASNATFKLIISPTPMVGPDDAYKKDNHTNPQGFRQEGEAFFSWLKDEGFLNEHLYVVCGDRHWQYHAQHPIGIEEFSCGALVDNNSRAGRLAGDPNSTDPDGAIQQFFIQGTQESASGGFLKIDVKLSNDLPSCIFTFYDEKGAQLYQEIKLAM